MFWSNQWNGTNIAKNCFRPQNVPHSKTKLFWCFKAFSQKLTENFSFGLNAEKFDLMETTFFGQPRTIINKNFFLPQLFFLNKFEKGQILTNILIWWKQLFFGQTRVTGQILHKKNNIHRQNVPHRAKLSFSGFWKHFRGNFLFWR